MHKNLYSQDATQECLDKTLLKDVNGLTRFPVQGSIRDFNYQIVLPQDLTCNQCVFQVFLNQGFFLISFYCIEFSSGNTIAVIHGE